MNPDRRHTLRLFDTVLRLIEKNAPSDRLLLRILFFVIIFSGVWLAYTVNQHYSSETPIRGGELVEGIIGIPRFINPTLAITRADQDVTALVYSGLLRIDSTGELVPDVAESITVSDDGLTYNIIVRKDVRFSDGTPLTASDVAFTIGLVQNPDLKSPYRGNWSDVTVEQIGEYELNVVLQEAYAPFVENFLLGIMPAHLWSALPIEQLPFSRLNTEPIGSGPFTVVSAERDPSGLITSYTLQAHRDALIPPKIDTLRIRFYSDESSLISALEQQLVDSSASISHENIDALLATGGWQLIERPLPRVFGIFFNQNKSPALRDKAVREALATAIDLDTLVKRALSGHGVPIAPPVREEVDTLQSEEGSQAVASSSRKEQVRALLNNAGWILNNQGLYEKQIGGSTETLAITLRTSNAPLFNAISQVIADEWKAVGIEVTIEQFDQAGLVQSVIRPRDFEALLFGLDMSRSEDLYPFWHSSQKDDPGLNIAMYTNVSVDALLEKARIEQDKQARHAILNEAQTTIASERPALFLFRPMMVYIVKEDIIVSDMNQVGKPSDRFSTITDWYTKSDTLWNFFKEHHYY